MNIKDDDAVRLRVIAKRINLITEALRKVHNDIGLPVELSPALGHLGNAEAIILGVVS